MKAFSSFCAIHPMDELKREQSTKKQLKAEAKLRKKAATTKSSKVSGGWTLTRNVVAGTRMGRSIFALHFYRQMNYLLNKSTGKINYYFDNLVTSRGNKV